MASLCASKINRLFASAAAHSAALLLLFTSIQFSAARDKATVAAELNNLFRQTNGWIGADGSFSVPLSAEKTVWLFSDTFTGSVADGKRVKPRMINNSIAIQRVGQAPEFFYPTNANGESQSFIKPESGEGFFWLFHGLRTEQGLFIFMPRVKLTGGNSPFAFKTIGESFATIPNPDDHPSEWKIQQQTFPFSEYSEERRCGFGSAVMEHEGIAYIYGYNSRKPKGKSGMIVARVPKEKFSEFSAWEFFNGKGWTNDFDAVALIAEPAPSECSVAFQPVLKKFVWIYAEGLGGKIVLRTAKRPEGPWNSPREIYRCPEMKLSSKTFCYAGKAHPELSQPDELLITYAVNSYNFFELVNDARFYWPQFIRLKVRR